jgi:ketosteroid isomerase-like protein
MTTPLTSQADISGRQCSEDTPLDQLRKGHRRIVERYLHSGHGEDLLHRHELFCEDGISGLWTSDSGSPVFAQGRESIARYDLWSAEHFPDWQWHDIRIWQTDDPQQLWAECDGEGTVVLPGHPAVHYANHFIYSFEMRDGLILREREFMNPITEMHALGMHTPTIDLGDFPGDH